MGLQVYRQKRDFSKTREPDSGKASGKQPLFVVQEHWASHHHFDFRLEAFGTLKSWAVPKGPSMVPGEKRLAVEVEDHPIDYAKFKGEIPKGEYGAGHVEIWDKGTWVPPDHLRDHLKKGDLTFELKGKKLKGRFLLRRTGKSSGRKSQWLLIKRHDEDSKEKAAGPKKKLLSAKGSDPFPKVKGPQLALLSKKVPVGGDWLHEIKWDGYRSFVNVQGNSVKFLTRSGLDWTNKYAPLDKEFKKLGAKSAIFDGEIVALGADGHPSFADLQDAISRHDMRNVAIYLFDLLYWNGHDLREKPLEERKELLKEILKKNKSAKLRFSEHWRATGDELFGKACEEGWEGIISKNRLSPYVSARSDSWQKIKCSLRQELVIGGYTEPEGERSSFGSLLMGAFEQGKFRYVGRVGTGFTMKTLASLYKKLEALESEECPFTAGAPKKGRGVHWVKPKLVAEIEFKTWTNDGILRHASFQGLREDKPASNVHVEQPVAENAKPAKAVQKKEPGFHITHPDRVIFAKDKVTKMDVASYYRSVAPWLLPHLVSRPLSLLRCPSSAGGDCFFQKHIAHATLSALREAQIENQKTVSVTDEQGLLQLVQWGVLELHTWQVHLKDPLRPDQLIFDLDPDAALPWKKIVHAAFELRELLERLGLESFVKTTGGKGLHLHVPIAPLYSNEQTKAFCKTVGQQLESSRPELYTVNSRFARRKGRIFIDYLRNGFGATAVAPYSLRNKEHPFVAVPITWEELKKLKGPQVFDHKSTLQRLARQKKDPWPGYLKLRQKVKILDHK